MPHTSAGAFQSELGSTEPPSEETRRRSAANGSFEAEADDSSGGVTHSGLTTRRPRGVGRARAGPSRALRDRTGDERRVKGCDPRHLVAAGHPPALSPARDASLRSAAGIPASITVHDSATQNPRESRRSNGVRGRGGDYIWGITEGGP